MLEFHGFPAIIFTPPYRQQNSANKPRLFINHFETNTNNPSNLKFSTKNIKNNLPTTSTTTVTKRGRKSNRQIELKPAHTATHPSPFSGGIKIKEYTLACVRKLFDLENKTE